MLLLFPAVFSEDGHNIHSFSPFLEMKAAPPANGYAGCDGQDGRRVPDGGALGAEAQPQGVLGRIWKRMALCKGGLGRASKVGGGCPEAG